MENTEELIVAFRNDRDIPKFVARSLVNEKTIPELIDFTMHEKYPFPQYSSWILIHVTEKHLEKIQPYHHQLIDTFLMLKDPSAQRNIANCLIKMPFTSYREGELLDRLFDFLLDPNSKVALKVYAMYLIVDFIRIYPELEGELLAILEKNQELESPAYRSGMRIVIKRLAAQKRKMK